MVDKNLYLKLIKVYSRTFLFVLNHLLENINNKFNMENIYGWSARNPYIFQNFNLNIFDKLYGLVFGGTINGQIFNI